MNMDIRNSNGGMELQRGMAAVLRKYGFDSFVHSRHCPEESNTKHHFEEGPYRVVWPIDNEQLLAAHKLRAEVFCRELRWVGSDDTQMEFDEFDLGAHHLGVIDESESVVGTLRFLLPTQEWLMERYFSKLLPPNFRFLKQEDTVEVSRMAVNSAMRGLKVTRGRGVADMLYKGIFRYCMEQRKTKAYIVISRAVLKHLRVHRMPVRTIGPEVKMPDGVKAVAAVLDWKKLIESTNSGDKKLLSWFGESIPNRISWPLRLRGAGSRHRAYGRYS